MFVRNKVTIKARRHKSSWNLCCDGILCGKILDFVKKILAAAFFLGLGMAWAEGQYTARQLAARFYYDLGPEQADVSSYPEKQQGNYRIFAKICSQCHTPARALNSPLIERGDWKRFVSRMHSKTKITSGPVMSRQDAQAVVNFLAYASQIRKVKNKIVFAAKSKELQALFEDIRKERD